MKLFGKENRATDPNLGDARKTFEWPPNYKGENLLWKLPRNIQWNDNVVVKEDEYAVFFRDGKAMHVFDRPGRYAITTQNVPVLGTLGAKLTGVRQLGEIYYLQRREFRSKFGTSEPLTFRDTDFGVVRIRAFGQFAYKVTDPMLLITQFVGTKGMANSTEIVGWLKDQIVMVLNDTLGELKRDKQMGVLDMPAYLQEIEQICLARLGDETSQYGLKITKFSGLNLNLPDEVQEAIDKRGAMAALGVNYMQYQTGKAIEGVGEGAAKGGDAAGFAGIGAGMGAGFAMAGAMSQGMQPIGGTGMQPIGGAPAAPMGAATICPKCGQPVPSGVKFCPNCGNPMTPQQQGTIPCPKCGQPVQLGAKFCPNCGNPMAMSCPKCGQPVQVGAKFCPNCGSPL